MIIRLTSEQIPTFWDIIKYSLQQVERIGSDRGQEEFNLLFAALMSDKAQCFIKYTDDSRQEICAIMITEVHQHNISKKFSLKLRSLYAFKPFDLNEWPENFKILLKLCKTEKCNSIIFESNHPKILAMAKNVGFEKLHTTLKFSIGD